MKNNMKYSEIVYFRGSKKQTILMIGKFMFSDVKDIFVIYTIWLTCEKHNKITSTSFSSAKLQLLCAKYTTPLKQHCAKQYE